MTDRSGTHFRTSGAHSRTFGTHSRTSGSHSRTLGPEHSSARLERYPPYPPPGSLPYPPSRSRRHPPIQFSPYPPARFLWYPPTHSLPYPAWLSRYLALGSAQGYVCKAVSSSELGCDARHCPVLAQGVLLCGARY
eukprot:1681270-Rhodomonas_salina.1